MVNLEESLLNAGNQVIEDLNLAYYYLENAKLQTCIFHLTQFRIRLCFILSISLSLLVVCKSKQDRTHFSVS